MIVKERRKEICLWRLTFVHSRTVVTPWHLSMHRCPNLICLHSFLLACLRTMKALSLRRSFNDQNQLWLSFGLACCYMSLAFSRCILLLYWWSCILTESALAREHVRPPCNCLVFVMVSGPTSTRMEPPSFARLALHWTRCWASHSLVPVN